MPLECRIELNSLPAVHIKLLCMLAYCAAPGFGFDHLHLRLSVCPQDILIQGEGGAQILVDPDLVEHFEVGQWLLYIE
jgi:hypothetical protein